MKVSRYHKFLRISVIVTTLVLLFDGGFIAPISKQLADVTISYVASVGTGMTASIPKNEYNELAAQLAEQKRVLDARELALNERNISARSFGDVTEQDYSTYILSAILFLLTVLIVLNYAMDWRRLKREQYEQSMA